MTNSFRALGIAACAATLACACGLGESSSKAPEARSKAPSQAAAAQANPSSQTGPSQTGPGQTEPTGEVLHVIVGRSMFINTPNRLRRVYVSNPDVLDSFTATPNQIVVTAKAPGMATLVIWDEAEQAHVYSVSADVDVEGLQSALHEAFPNDNIKAEAREGHISLTGVVTSDASSESAFKLASLYSKTVANSLLVNPSHIKQVRLKVRIIEIDRSRLEQLGINFFTGGKNGSAVSTGQFPVSTSLTTGTPIGIVSTGLTISDPLNLFYYNTDLNIGVAIKALQDRQLLQILAEPTLSTLSGQKASFLSGGEFPYPVVQGGTAGGAAAVTIQFRPYGVKLDFTPLVNADGTIELKVAPEVSALDYTNAVTISGFTIPALSTRRADTQVELRNGQSFAISGLLDHRTTDQLNKVPRLGDLPVLGTLFRSKTINHSIVELVAIVTPTIVDPLTDNSPPAEPAIFPGSMADPGMSDKEFMKQTKSTKPVSQPR